MVNKYLNCILCKYNFNKEKCINNIQTINWHCPSLSNLYYGTLIRYYPFKLIYKIQLKLKGW